jgi:hypothetical protein
MLTSRNTIALTFCLLSSLTLRRAESTTGQASWHDPALP